MQSVRKHESQGEMKIRFPWTIHLIPFPSLERCEYLSISHKHTHNHTQPYTQPHTHTHTSNGPSRLIFVEKTKKTIVVFLKLSFILTKKTNKPNNNNNNNNTSNKQTNTTNVKIHHVMQDMQPLKTSCPSINPGLGPA